MEQLKMGGQAAYGIIPGMNPEVEPAIRVADFKFFECLWPKRSYNDIVIAGPFGVQCKENDETGKLRVKWNIRRDAMIRFVADDGQRATAWIVDDRYWHNRLYLMDSADMFPILSYHTRMGTYPAAYILLEIQCMAEVLKDQRKIFEIVRSDGKRPTFYYTRKDAEREIDRLKRALSVTKFTKDGIIQESKDEFDYSVSESTRLEYKSEIRQLAQKYRNLEFGWTMCNEFGNHYRPLIEERIAERRKNLEQSGQTVITKSALFEGLRKLDPRELDEIRGLILGEPEQKDEAVEEVETKPQEETTEEVFDAPVQPEVQEVESKPEPEVDEEPKQKAPAKRRRGRPKKGK